MEQSRTSAPLLTVLIVVGMLLLGVGLYTAAYLSLGTSGFFLQNAGAGSNPRTVKIRTYSSPWLPLAFAPAGAVESAVTGTEVLVAYSDVNVP